MIEVYTDGATRGNPGISGAGIYIKAAGEKLEFAIPLPEMTNHEAEFHAVLEALKICQVKFPGEILSLRTDSSVVVQAIEDEQIKNKQFQPLLLDIQRLAKEFPHFFIKWIPSKQNNHADRLARQAIHENRFS